MAKIQYNTEQKTEEAFFLKWTERMVNFLTCFVDDLKGKKKKKIFFQWVENI